MSAEWLDRTLVMSPYYIGLCLSEADYVSVLDHCGVKPENRDAWDMGNAHARMRHFLDDEGKPIAVVTMDKDFAKTKTGCQVAALLCHEAVHIFQRIRDRIGETVPSDEFMAYSIQNIAQALMESYVRQATGDRYANSKSGSNWRKQGKRRAQRGRGA